MDIIPNNVNTVEVVPNKKTNIIIKILLIVFCIAIVFFVGYVLGRENINRNEKNISMNDVQKKEILRNDYSIAVPLNWDDVTTTLIMGPKQGIYGPTLSVVTEKLNKNINIKQYTDEQYQNLVKEIDNYTLQKEGEYQIEQNIPAYYRIHSFPLPEYGIDVTQIQVYVLKEKDAFIFTASEISSLFQTKLPMFEEMIKKVKIN